MNLGTARTQLRLMLGDQSESLWSDTNLNSLLDRANLRMWRRISQQDASSPATLTHWKYPKGTASISITGAASSNFTVQGIDLNEIISFEGALWKSYDGGNVEGSYSNLPIGTTAEYKEMDWASGGTSPLYDLVNIYPQIAGGYVGFVGSAKTQLLIRPTPTADLMIRGLVTLDVDEDVLSFNGDATPLLNNVYFSLHEAVVYDAGFLASFKDESLRQEFITMREDVLNLHTEGTLLAKEAY